MNELEYEMVEVLKQLKDYGVFEIKAEFEAEGSRMEEMMRLKDVTSKVDLPIILKIGGCEAVTDIYNALSIGVKGIVAPMIETPYAMSKYLGMIKTMIAEDNAEDIEFAFNMETNIAAKNLEKMLECKDISMLHGMTIGRVDLSGSLGIDRGDINNSIPVRNHCLWSFSLARKYNLHTALGGAICDKALPFIQELDEKGFIDKFETRKVVFRSDAWKHGVEAIQTAVKFELLWLKSKRRYYSRIKTEDEKRIDMLEGRLK